MFSGISNKECIEQSCVNIKVKTIRDEEVFNGSLSPDTTVAELKRALPISDMRLVFAGVVLSGHFVAQHSVTTLKRFKNLA